MSETQVYDLAWQRWVSLTSDEAARRVETWLGLSEDTEDRPSQAAIRVAAPLIRERQPQFVTTNTDGGITLSLPGCVVNIESDGEVIEVTIPTRAVL